MATLVVAFVALASAAAHADLFVWGQRADDMRLVNRAPGWNTVPLALTRNGAAFEVRNPTSTLVAQFATAAATPGMALLQGDFDGDGRADMALLNTAINGQVQAMLVAYANADGTQRIESRSIGQFGIWATSPGVEPVVGDFNGDGRSDVALIRREPGWASAPVLLSRKDLGFDVANWPLGSFAGWATEAGAEWDSVRLVAGRFDSDSLTDLALVRPCGSWTDIRVAHALPSGGFRVQSYPAGQFLGRACAYVGASNVVTGDFDGNGMTDFAAFANGELVLARATGGGFATSIPISGGFAQRAAGAVVLTGRFDAGASTDIALVNTSGSWNSIAVAFGLSNGQFQTFDVAAGNFPVWAAQGAQPVAGDFDGNGMSDIALLPRSGMAWKTIPVAYMGYNARPDCSGDVCSNTGTATPWFSVQNQAAPDFVDWAMVDSAQILVGEFGR